MYHETLPPRKTLCGPPPPLRVLRLSSVSRGRGPAPTPRMGEGPRGPCRRPRTVGASLASQVGRRRPRMCLGAPTTSWTRRRRLSANASALSTTVYAVKRPNTRGHPWGPVRLWARPARRPADVRFLSNVSSRVWLERPSPAK